MEPSEQASDDNFDVNENQEQGEEDMEEAVNEGHAKESENLEQKQDERMSDAGAISNSKEDEQGEEDMEEAVNKEHAKESENLEQNQDERMSDTGAISNSKEDEQVGERMEATKEELRMEGATKKDHTEDTNQRMETEQREDLLDNKEPSALEEYEQVGERMEATKEELRMEGATKKDHTEDTNQRMETEQREDLLDNKEPSALEEYEQVGESTGKVVNEEHSEDNDKKPDTDQDENLLGSDVPITSEIYGQNTVRTNESSSDKQHNLPEENTECSSVPTKGITTNSEVSWTERGPTPTGDEVREHTGSETDRSQTSTEQPQTGAEKHSGMESEEEGEEERHAEKEIKRKIPEDFYYNYEDLCSKPFVSAESGIPSNLLQMIHSFGYDCTKRANLQLLEGHTVIIAAGNLLVILNLKTKEQKYLRSMSGGGIGAITVHPSRKYFVVAEKGTKPNIIVYEYPSLHPYRILRGGTEEAYAFVDFNPSGTLLASVGCSPDYMLTVWDWKEEQIVLKSKAFSQDVFRVTFSPDNEGQLTTSGTGHIKFWKMARTFTGLKLQGQLGRFGKTALTDIEGYVELPDGKVVSGSEWGNLLLWEGGLIKVELCRRGRRSCHAGPINQFFLDEGELITVGADGYVRVWDFETVDTADSVDDSGLLEMEPMNELLVQRNVNLRSMVKTTDPESAIWFAQDTNGAIWKLDLSFSNMTQDPECLFSFHSGEIQGLDVSPTTHLMASTAFDCSVKIYDFLGKQLLTDMKFKQGGTALCWAPRLVNPKGGLFAVGFKDGVVRILEVFSPKGLAIVAGRTSIGEAEVRLKQAFKPHTAPICALAYERNGEVLATGSQDNTVFFFAVGDKYEPIGFISVPGPVIGLEWSPFEHELSTLLVLCENGYVLQVQAPKLETKDTKSTYEIQDLPREVFHFRSIKSKIKREEEVARRQKKREMKQKEREAMIQRKKELGEEIQEEDLKEEPEKEEELPPIVIPKEPSPILCGFYSSPGKFWLSLSGYDSGMLYHCQFPQHKNANEDFSKQHDEPFAFVPVENADNTSVRSIHFSKQLMICGMENGTLRVYPLQANDLTLASMHGYWSLPMHDNQYGCIRSVCSSYDGQFVVSCGADSNIFVYSLLSQEDIEQAMKGKRAKIPSPRKDLILGKVVEDIEDPNAYSIENAKQKAEYDRLMKLAEKKKAEKRNELYTLRNEFKQLLQRNAELPEHMQLERAEFELDPRIRQETERQTAERVNLVRKELAWEQDKYKIGLQKLKAMFRDEIEFDTTVVHAIESEHQVSTYRLLRLSEEYHKLRKQMEQRNQAKSEQHSKAGDHGKDIAGAEISVTGETGEVLVHIGTRRGTVTQLPQRKGEKLQKSKERAEKAKARISKRKKEWEDFFAGKPDENYEDPLDVAAIKEAQEKMGDFKLKSAKDYSVPEHLRVNAERKTEQLIVLEGLIHDLKADMNRRILSLRDLKIATIDQIQRFKNELKSVQSKIHPSLHFPVPKVPKMYPDEVPEKIFEYSKETLHNYEKEAKNKAKHTDVTEQQGGFAGFGGFSASNTTSKSIKQIRASSVTVSESGHSSHDLEQRQEESELTELEKELFKTEEIRNLYRQEYLVQKINEMVITFDAEVLFLRHQKMKLDMQMKLADLRHVTLFEELLLLKEFEKRENVLQEKVNSRINEKQEVQRKSEECQQQIEAKKREITKLQEREKVIEDAFHVSLGENNKFADFLTKVFKKKVKRIKKKEREGEEDEDGESEDESDEESEWDSEDEDSKSETGMLNDSVCPPNCDPELFENTLQLREKRLDVEEAISEEKKSAENLKKDYDSLAKKSKVIEVSLKTAEADLEAFQREKQQKLNELFVVAPLKLHQVEYVVNGVLPNDLSQALIFTNQALVSLQQRIRELQQEKLEQRELYHQARQQHVQIVRDRKEMETKIQKLEEKCSQLMMMKFGRIVDLESLQTFSESRVLEELKEQTRLKELELFKQAKQWEDVISQQKDQLTLVTKEQTLRLQQMNALLLEKKDLENKLEARQKNTGKEFQGMRKAEVEERQRLVNLVQLQVQEIETLREEIDLLSRKGGHILPPSQPPLTHSKVISPTST
ncbi:cilia- and flagella-associated protein 44 [Protopterus annectens]|uniref:cilia- and flagella-associated protein 44 n=1 Tax=Protopterus annectens TaxID=7888 RepID=UPI001CFB68F3|nr:cilia- and flagella-associated protein 44 [Protopterus annectens]